MAAQGAPAVTAAMQPAPRWHIDKLALGVLEACFSVEQFPNVNVRKQLGQDLQVSARQIQVWFQNRRQRERKRRENGQRSDTTLSSFGSSNSTLSPPPAPSSSSSSV